MFAALFDDPEAAARADRIRLRTDAPALFSTPPASPQGPRVLFPKETRDLC